MMQANVGPTVPPGTGPNFIKLFIISINKQQHLARVIFHGKLFKPFLMFEGKARAYPEFTQTIPRAYPFQDPTLG